MAEGDDKAGRVRHFGVFWGVANVAFVWCCLLLASSLCLFPNECPSPRHSSSPPPPPPPHSSAATSLTLCSHSLTPSLLLFVPSCQLAINSTSSCCQPTFDRRFGYSSLVARPYSSSSSPAAASLFFSTHRNRLDCLFSKAFLSIAVVEPTFISNHVGLLLRSPESPPIGHAIARLIVAQPPVKESAPPVRLP